MGDIPDHAEPLARVIDRAREAVGAVAFQLDAGLLRGGSADVADALRSAEQALDALGGDARPAADAAPARAGAAGAQADALVFDVSDLFHYFPDNRLPTGVQRVQISVILSLLDAPGGWDVSLARFVEGRDEWLAVPSASFRRICAMSFAEGNASAPDWRAAVAQLEAVVASGPALAFARGTCLVNLGSSWWSPNYFLHVRRAKAAFGIRYVPLIHDMIPALMAKDCHPDLVHEFIDWLIGVLLHADAFLANSDATKADLQRFAARLDRAIPDDRVVVVPLQAGLGGTRRAPPDAGLLARWRLSPGSFVLLVSTLEIRKNQLGAFEAWQRLIGVNGKHKVPTLVCVGKRGFRSHELFERHAASADLQEKVLILEYVDDAELDALYANCLFTLYPSFYEGWGLPVSESLAHGKVPLTADNSSLPQAGAGLSDMFATGSLTGMVAALERLIYDREHRARKEAAIARGFVARHWSDVAGEMAAGLHALMARVADAPPGWPALDAPPGYYSLTRNRELRVSAGMGSAEAFRDRGWWRLEDFGSWTRVRGGAVRMRLPPGPARIGFELAGLPTLDTGVTIAIEGLDVMIEGMVAPNARKWMFLDIPDVPADGVVTARVTGQRTEVVVAADGKESREIGVGLRGFFVFDTANPRARLDFVEAVAFGALDAERRIARR